MPGEGDFFTFCRILRAFSRDFGPPPSLSGVPPTLVAVRGDITRETVDAVVNAANSGLARGGGVCGALFAAAGPGLEAACAAVAPCPTGEARVTPGFALAAGWIVHAVGPVWHGGDRDEPALLAAAYRSALAAADSVGARSIAFPAISTGIFGYPLEAATEVAVAAVRAADTAVSLVRFVCFDDATLAVYERVLAG